MGSETRLVQCSKAFEIKSCSVMWGASVTHFLLYYINSGSVASYSVSLVLCMCSFFYGEMFLC